jgi:hypothetical protein
MDPASKFRIGTSGYSFDDWVGPFYPPGTRRQEGAGPLPRRHLPDGCFTGEVEIGCG